MGGFLACDGPKGKPPWSTEICILVLAPHQWKHPLSGPQFYHLEDGSVGLRTFISKDPRAPPQTQPVAPAGPGTALF